MSKAPFTEASDNRSSAHGLELLKFAGESGIGGLDALNTLDDGLALGKEPRDGEGHGDAVVAERVDLGPLESGASRDFHAVGEFINRHTHAAQVFGDSRDAVALFDAEFLRILDDRLPLGEGSGDGKDGDFVN